MVGGEPGILHRFKLLESHLDERLRRLVAAAEAEALGARGISLVSRSTGVSRRAIRQGLQELREAEPPKPSGPHRIRRAGGGRKKTIEKDPSLRADLEQLVEPTERGDPASPLRWTCRSVRQLAQELRSQGHQVSHQLVSEILHELGYSLQANRKTVEGTDHPDRDAQFAHINRRQPFPRPRPRPLAAATTASTHARRAPTSARLALQRRATAAAEGTRNRDRWRSPAAASPPGPLSRVS